MRVHIRREVELQPESEGGYGYTPGCRGCLAAEANLPAVAHNEECRKRIESAMLSGGLDAHRVQAAVRKRKATEDLSGGHAASPKTEASASSTSTTLGQSTPPTTAMGSSDNSGKGEKRKAEEDLEGIDISSMITRFHSSVVIHLGSRHLMMCFVWTA